MTGGGEAGAGSGRSGGWLAPFSRPGYPAYAAANGGASFSWAVSSVVFSWVTLIVTGDPVAVGAVFAVRISALLVFGIPAGVLADRVDRRMLIIGVSLAGAMIAIALAITAVVNDGSVPFWMLLVASFLLGIFDAARIASATAYAFDLVGPALATSGIAIANLVAQVFGIAGSFTSGYLLEQYGLALALTSMAAGLFASAGLLLFGPSPPRRDGGRRTAPTMSLRSSLTLLRRNHVLAILTLTVIVTEVFGFSSQTLIPVFARDVFHEGPDAYGAMSAARSVGGVIGLLVLIRVGSRATRGSVLMGIDMVLGGALMALALAPTFALALIPLAVVGAAAASCDSLSQSLMQRSTGDAERGAAMGIWAFAVGVGPIGHLAIGAAAQRLGAPATQMLFGGVLVILAGLLLLNPVIRRLR